ncbi:hypothetical protein ASC94_13730 [Massilia sp. Root418]|uniref:hypothetical protein n=1 Tax=Massilia sp. Root418 TaxID=1736532 RepID=UPI0006FA519E|nr:hypothetical protein [Massilia sp. Root418]KQW93659.1 hypothetical protein ASC94_13730 [Massilia sp. Root418]
MPVFIPYDTLEALGNFTGNWWSDTYAMEPFILEAIGNYIKAPAAQQQQQQQPAVPSEAGYQWKQVFLPEGTRLRASFGKQPYYATVEGAQIKYGDHAVSPSCFANLHGSGNRNAWKAIWLRFPGSDEWLLADVCRSARKAAIARLLGEPVQASPLPQETEKPPQPRPTASRSADGLRDKGARQPTTHPVAWLPPSAPAAKKTEDVKPSAGRSSRHKRRKAKHHPGIPR